MTTIHHKPSKSHGKIFKNIVVVIVVVIIIIIMNVVIIIIMNVVVVIIIIIIIAERKGPASSWLGPRQPLPLPHPHHRSIIIIIISSIIHHCPSFIFHQHGSKYVSM